MHRLFSVPGYTSQARLSPVRAATAGRCLALPACVLDSSHATNSIFSTTPAGHPPVSQNFVSNQRRPLSVCLQLHNYFTSSRVFLLLSLSSISDVYSFDHLSQIGLDCRGEKLAKPLPFLRTTALLFFFFCWMLIYYIHT